MGMIAYRIKEGKDGERKGKKGKEANKVREGKGHCFQQWWEAHSVLTAL